MKKLKLFSILLVCLLILSLSLAACNSNISDEPPTGQKIYTDERIELVSLVFKLAGNREEYSEATTTYQKELLETFSPLKSHDLITYSRSLNVAYNAIFNMALFIEKQNGEWILHEDYLTRVEDRRWSLSMALEFVKQLNDFYKVSSFETFYNNHLSFYQELSAQFEKDWLRDINMDWFSKYISTSHLAAYFSPSNNRNNYSCTIEKDDGPYVYVLCQGNGWALIHEFCHSFANKIAEDWYNNNQEFRKMSDESVNLRINPQYGNGSTMAREYITRAYTILYWVEHGKKYNLFDEDLAQGFPYIERVFKMIGGINPDPFRGKTLEEILDILTYSNYTKSQEFTVTFQGTSGTRTIKWFVIHYEKLSITDFYQTEVGNVFASKEGDVLLVDDSYILIDLGETTFEGRTGYRKYMRIQP